MGHATSKVPCHLQLGNIPRSQVKCGVTAAHVKHEARHDARCQAGQPSPLACCVDILYEITMHFSHISLTPARRSDDGAGHLP